MIVKTTTHTLSVENGSVEIKKNGNLSGLFGKQVIPFSEIHSVAIGGNDKRYMTAKRAIGAGLTGGLGLLTPTRVRGALAIGLTSGEVLTFTLNGKSAKNPEAIAMVFSVGGVEVM